MHIPDGHFRTVWNFLDDQHNLLGEVKALLPDIDMIVVVSKAVDGQDQRIGMKYLKQNHNGMVGGTSPPRYWMRGLCAISSLEDKCDRSSIGNIRRCKEENMASDLFYFLRVGTGNLNQGFLPNCRIGTKNIPTNMKNIILIILSFFSLFSRAVSQSALLQIRSSFSVDIYPQILQCL